VEEKGKHIHEEKVGLHRDRDLKGGEKCNRLCCKGEKAGITEGKRVSFHYITTKDPRKKRKGAGWCEIFYWKKLHH